MNDDVAKNRLSKRELICDDDSASKQPTEKSAKSDAESIPSSGVVELQKKVVELERKLLEAEKTSQGACRIAQQAQARTQILENLLYSKPKVADGAKNLGREDELEKKVRELSTQLEEERINKKEREDELHKKVNDVTVQLKVERMKHRQRIHELTSKLAHYEGLLQLPQMQQPQPQPQPQLASQTLQQLLLPLFPGFIIPQPQQPPAALVVSPLLQQQQLPTQQFKTIKEVTLRAKFTDISKIIHVKVCSESTEFSGLAWKLGVFRRDHVIEFSLNIESPQRLPFPSFTADLQLTCHKPDQFLPIGVKDKYVLTNSIAQVLTSRNLQKLVDQAFVVDDSIIVTVVIKALARN